MDGALPSVKMKCSTGLDQRVDDGIGVRAGKIRVARAGHDDFAAYNARIYPFGDSLIVPTDFGGKCP